MWENFLGKHYEDKKTISVTIGMADDGALRITVNDAETNGSVRFYIGPGEDPDLEAGMALRLGQEVLSWAKSVREEAAQEGA